MPDAVEGAELRFQANVLELIRRYTWQGERLSTLCNSLELKPEREVIDVGCGTGALTRILGRKLDPESGGRITGVDSNEKLLESAAQLAREDGLDLGVISFIEGDAKRLPFPENYADVVVCQSLLWLMTEEDRRASVREMIRVCKHGGIVGAVESAINTAVSYYAGQPRLTELARKEARAQAEGYRRLYGFDRNIGPRMPEILQASGLTRVRMDGVADVRLQCDDRVPREQKLAESEYFDSYNGKTLSRLEVATTQAEKKSIVEQSEPVLTAGGMAWEEIYELKKLYSEYFQATLRDPRRIAGDSSVNAWTVFITTGVKV